MPALTVNHLRRSVQAAGGTLEENSEGRTRRFNCCSPVGKCWACDGSLHMLVVEWYHGDSSQEALRDGLDRVADGLTDCDDPECDYCHPE